MRFNGRIMLTAMALAAVSVVGSAVAVGASKALNEAEAGIIIESRVLLKSDALYQIKSDALQGGELAEPFISEIRYPAGWNWRAKGALMEIQMNWLESKKRDEKPKRIPYSDPVIPTGVPQIGAKLTTSDSCALRRHGPSIDDVTYGLATWYWEYRYRVDSNGDGEKDSEPGWTLTKEAFSVYRDAPDNPVRC